MLLASRVDGRPADSLPLDDRGLAYGDGLFETIRMVGGRAPLLEFHLERITRGAERLGMVVNPALLDDEVRAFIAGLGAAGHADAIVKLIVTRGSTGRGYRPPADATPRRLLLAFAAATWPAGNARDGIALFECSTRLAINPVLAGMKHLNRLEQVLARREWDGPAFAEGLLLDSEGRVVECTMSNLFMVVDGELVTPRLQRCGVAGVMRAFLMARALTLGMGLSERDVSRADLNAADELFVCNSGFGIWPVAHLGDRAWQPGPVTRSLQATVDALWVNGCEA